MSRAHPTVLLLLVGCLIVSACGPSLGEDSGPPPDPMAPEVVGARLIATNAVDDALAAAAAALDGRIVARTSTDACYAGQNNYKVHDGYDHRCTLRHAVVVGLDGDFRKRIAGLDERLFGAGWGCHRDPCEETLASRVEEYWDFRKAEYGGHDPPISSLPTTSSYVRDELYLEVDYFGQDPSGRGSLERFHARWRGGLFTSFERSRPFDVDSILARAKRFDHVVGLAIETDYFEDAEIG